jgi:hypothetical protein
MTAGTELREQGWVPRFPISLSARIRIGTLHTLRKHRIDLGLLAALLVVAGWVHAKGMGDYPNWVDDPGTYLSQAWAVQYEHATSPYTYFYDHAPGGWIQMALWGWLTDGFGRHAYAIDFGNEVMLIGKLASTALIYLLGRRLGFGRLWAAVAVLLYVLCPLTVVYTRWTFLDNIVTPWMLGAFLLAANRRKHLIGTAGAAFCFAVAALTKETALVAAPAFCLALWQNSDPRTRGKAFAVAGLTGSVMLLYPAFAVVKSELLPGSGHTSLLGTAIWQLGQRQSSGSVLSGNTPGHDLWLTWLQYDAFLVPAGIAAAVVALLIRPLRPLALAMAGFGMVLVTGGYIPYMQIINLLPFAALLLAGVLSRLVPAVARRVGGRAGRGGAGHSLLRPAAVATALSLAVVAILAGVVGPRWTARDAGMTGAHEEPPLKQADRWVGASIPRDKVVVVHDALWTDLVAKDHFRPDNVIVVYKLDGDPAVHERVRRIDYLVLPDYYYRTSAAQGQYPTAIRARDHAVAVAHFGSDPTSAVTVYRVSSHWSPKSTS